jgi:regulator of CtrA degradation
MKLTDKLIDGLYVEAMLLSDEARAYFDASGRGERDLLTPLQRVNFSCESLKVTTRLMHIIAWLLSRRSGTRESSDARLGAASPSAPETVATLPEAARVLIAASEDLYDRVARLDRQFRASSPTANAARSLMTRLERAF